MLLIGWDAADWKVVSPLIDAGKMPNLEKLINGGVAGNMATLYPVLSPMLWTSIATGKRAFKHGIHGFAEPGPNGGVRPISNLSRKVKAVWNILNQNEFISNVIGWWPSQPVEPINGVMVSDLYYRATGRLDADWPMPPGTVHPERLVEPLMEFRVHPAEITGEDLLPFVPTAAYIDQGKDKRLESLAKLIAECSSVHAAATAVMQLEPWDFMAVYFDAIDHFSHGFMRYHPPQQDWISDEDFGHYKDVIAGAYQFHDLMLGTLLALAGEEVTVIVISDHGFHPDHLRPMVVPNEPAGLAAEHRSQGILVMNGPGIRKDELVFGATLLDVTPTILSLFGLPVGRDMDGKVLTQAFESEPPLNFIDSWESVEGESGMHPAERRHDPVENHEAIAQLVALGYIAEPGGDKQKATEHTVQELRYNLARAYVGAHWHDPAIDIFRELWDSAPDETRFGVNLFRSLLARKRVAEARETFREIHSSKKLAIEHATEELGRLEEEREGKDPKDFTDQQNRRFRLLKRKAGVNPEAFAFLEGTLLGAEGRHQEAIEKLKQARNVQPHYQPSLYEKLGDAYVAIEAWNNAEQSFARSVELDPSNSSPHVGLARCYLGRDQPLRAAVSAREAIALNFQNPQAHFVHGLALQRLGRMSEAVEALEIAVRQHPAFPKAHEVLASIYGEHLHNPEKQRFHRKVEMEAVQRLAGIRTGKRMPSEFATQEDLLKNLNNADDSNETKSGQWSADETVVVVSGLPRSGTSLMMQILDAGGFEVLSDGNREADSSNPKGYFEYEKVTKLQQDNSWVEQSCGKCVKIVAHLLPFLPKGLNYRVLWMERDLGAVITSQKRMLARLGRSGAQLSDDHLAQVFSRQLQEIGMVLKRFPCVNILRVDYDDLIDSPDEAVARLNAFMGGSLDESAALSVVDPELRNERRQI